MATPEDTMIVLIGWLHPLPALSATVYRPAARDALARIRSLRHGRSASTASAARPSGTPRVSLAPNPAVLFADVSIGAASSLIPGFGQSGRDRRDAAGNRRTALGRELFTPASRSRALMAAAAAATGGGS